MSTHKKHRASGGHSNSSSASESSSMGSSQDLKLKTMFKELHTLVFQVQDQRKKSELNLNLIAKTHDKIQSDQKTGKALTTHSKSKLKGLYSDSIADAESEAVVIAEALAKISEIKEFKNQKLLASSSDGKHLMRRSVLMQVLQNYATSLPLWVGKPRQEPPPLCGAVPPEPSYLAERGDKVAARVRSGDGDENWILAECVAFDRASSKYDVDDIDAEEDQERRHVLSRRRVLPLPKWRANPDTHPEALFPKRTLVLALYPQTTCFYRGVIEAPPETYSEDYSVLFEDTTYPGGYSPPFAVAQRYVVQCKETKKK